MPRNFFSNLMNRFLDAMRLAEDDDVIEAVTSKTSLIKRTGDSFLSLMNFTDLADYGLSIRQGHCLQVQFNDHRLKNRAFFDQSVVTEKDSSKELLWKLITSDQESDLGLMKASVRFDTVALEFCQLSDPKKLHLYLFPNQFGGKITISGTTASAGLYDLHIGRYDYLEIVRFCHQDEDDETTYIFDMLKLDYYTDNQLIYSEDIQVDHTSSPTSTDTPDYLLMKQTYHSRF